MTPAEIRECIADVREWHEVTQFGRITRLLEILDSGALFIAVPDGEPMPVYKVKTPFISGGDLYTKELLRMDTWEKEIFYSKTPIWPVKLLPLAELEATS